MKNKTFTYLNNSRICEIIESAQDHIIYAAPSLSKNIAQALVDFTKRNENGVFRIIVDDNAEAFRLGFGDFSGVKVLDENNIEIRKANGLRIAVLVADEVAWVYSPTPEIIFEQPNGTVNNGVSVSKDFVEQIIDSIAPEVNINNDVLETTILSSSKTPEIGAEKFETKDFEKIRIDLNSNPPQKFDATRKVRVYTGYFQFVELNLIGCRFTSKTISLPNSLLNLPANDEMRQRINSTCRLLDKQAGLTKDAKNFEDRLNKIRKQYIKPIGKRFGSVILRNKKDEFVAEINKKKIELDKLKKGIEAKLQNEIDESVQKLTEMFVDGVLKNPPDALSGQLPTAPTKQQAEMFIRDQLSAVLPKTNELIGIMEIHCDFKDVTYEMLNNKEFVENIRANFPYMELAKTYEEQETLAQRELFANPE